MPYEPDFSLGWTLQNNLLLEIKKQEEWLLFSDITIGGEYRIIRDYIKSLPVDKQVTFLDLGANVGFASWYFAGYLLQTKHQFRGLLVEPNPDTFLELSRRIKSQEQIIRGERQNILVALCGLVGKRTGRANLRIDGVHTISSVVSPSKGGVYIDTPYLDLADYLDDDPIDFIKLDIESSEWDFIANYQDILKRTNLVVMEIHHESGDAQELYRGMMEAGLIHHAVLKVKGNVSTECFSRINMVPWSCSSSRTLDNCNT